MNTARESEREHSKERWRLTNWLIPVCDERSAVGSQHGAGEKNKTIITIKSQDPVEIAQDVCERER